MRSMGNLSSTVVPVMIGHHRDQAKVSVHDGRPLVGGTGGRAGGAKRNTPCTTHGTTTSDIHTEYNVCIVIIMYDIVIEPKINAS